MRLTDITPGPAFRLALKVSSFSLLVSTLLCALIYNVVTQAMLYELKSQSKEEVLLLSDILKASGSEGLIEALGGLSRTHVPIGHIVGVFNALGEPLAGNLSVAPDFVGWKKTSVTLIKPRVYGHQHQYHAKVVRLSGHTLIVGRSDKLITAVQFKLTYSLLIASLIIALVTLLLGFTSSVASARKIRHMDDVLKRVSEGENRVRIKLKDATHPDQFDNLGQRINQHVDTLDELITGIKSTASAVAHDLKTPLAHTQFSLFEALELCQNGQDPTLLIENTITEVEQINTTFDTILRISRINTQLDRSHFQYFELWSVIEKVTELFAPVFDEKGHQISLQKESDSNRLLGDAGMLEQLLVNLLKNILVHCADGTHVIIRLATHSEGLTLTVQDDGAGIPEQEIDNVLKPFYRADKATEEPGNGLGLTLVAAIAHHHKASLTLHDCSPGLRVNVQFPAQIE